VYHVDTLLTLGDSTAVKNTVASMTKPIIDRTLNAIIMALGLETSSDGTSSEVGWKRGTDKGVENLADLSVLETRIQRGYALPGIQRKEDETWVQIHDGELMYGTRSDQ
jgi:hypothetical protein